MFLKRAHFTAIPLAVFMLLYSCTAIPQTITGNERYENLSLSNTQVRHIHSQNTGEDYRLYIDIPADYYDNPHKQYPLIILLDADYSFPITKLIAEHLSDRKRIQTPFIVGLAYDGPLHYQLNRTRDYTPTFVASGGYGPQYQKVSGGGPKFALFIQHELFPYLQSTFHLSKQSTLVGHSYGGLFASWLSLVKPELFSSYIIVSPSLWYDRPMIFNLQKKILGIKHPRKSPALFFAIGAKENLGSYKMISDLNQFTKIYQKEKQKYRYQIFPFEDHDTIFPTALSQGLLYLYGNK
ncbi:MAG: alpha/beta hydrolase-fold protein [Coxiellaceae bacterium]|nr:alpha/beta hydrolase-fold protein [Coxiellaceae bacterium]